MSNNLKKANKTLINNPFSSHPDAKAPIEQVVKQYSEMGTIIMKNIVKAKLEDTGKSKITPTVAKPSNTISNTLQAKAKRGRPRKEQVAVQGNHIVVTPKKTSVQLNSIQQKALKADSGKLDIKQLMSKYNVSQRTVYRILGKKLD